MNTHLSRWLVSLFVATGTVAACTTTETVQATDDDTTGAQGSTVSSTSSSVGASVSSSVGSGPASSSVSSTGSGFESTSAGTGGKSGQGGSGGEIVVPVGSGGEGGTPILVGAGGAIGEGGAGGAGGSGGDAGPVGDVCEGALGPVGPGFYADTLEPYAGDYTDYECVQGNGSQADGRDRVVFTEVPDTFRVSYSMISDDFDAVVMATQDCVDPTLSCIVATDRFVDWETATLLNNTGDDANLNLFLDAYEANTGGDFNFNMSIYSTAAGDDCNGNVWDVDEVAARDAGDDWFGGYVGFTDAFDPLGSSDECDFFAPGNDTAYTVDLLDGETLIVSVIPMDPDDNPSIYVTDDACDLDALCLGSDEGKGGEAEVVAIDALQDGSVVVIVDGGQNNDAGYRARFRIVDTEE